MAATHCPRGRHPDPSATCYRRCGCRCRGCKAIVGDDYRAWVHAYAAAGRRVIEVDAAPTRALVAWLVVERRASQRWVARAAGLSEQWVSEVRRGKRAAVKSTTAAKVRELVRRVAAGELTPGVPA